jgi:phosphatidylglycerophosphatase A
VGADKLLRSPSAWIATAGGVGYFPLISGTFGSAAGVLLFLGLSGLSAPLYVLTVVALSCLGIWAADRAEALFGQKDDGRIVIDEVAGQLVTLTPVLLLTGAAQGQSVGLEVGGETWWILVVTAFVVFRVLDIWKPGPVRWAERRFAGGLGVMLDDLLAGVFGGILMTLPCYGLLVSRLSQLSQPLSQLPQLSQPLSQLSQPLSQLSQVLQLLGLAA